MSAPQYPQRNSGGDCLQNFVWVLAGFFLFAWFCRGFWF